MIAGGGDNQCPFGSALAANVGEFEVTIRRRRGSCCLQWRKPRSLVKVGDDFTKMTRRIDRGVIDECRFRRIARRNDDRSTGVACCKDR